MQRRSTAGSCKKLDSDQALCSRVSCAIHQRRAVSNYAGRSPGSHTFHCTPYQHKQTRSSCTYVLCCFKIGVIYMTKNPYILNWVEKKDSLIQILASGLQQSRKKVTVVGNQMAGRKNDGGKGSRVAAYNGLSAFINHQSVYGNITRDTCLCGPSTPCSWRETQPASRASPIPCRETFRNNYSESRSRSRFVGGLFVPVPAHRAPIFESATQTSPPHSDTTPALPCPPLFDIASTHPPIPNEVHCRLRARLGALGRQRC